MLENAWRKCKIKLETTKTQRNQRRQRTDQRPRRRTDQRPRRRTDQRPSQEARRHSRLVSFFAHRGPSAPTPTSSGDGVGQFLLSHALLVLLAPPAAAAASPDGSNDTVVIFFNKYRSYIVKYVVGGRKINFSRPELVQ